MRSYLAEMPLSDQAREFIAVSFEIELSGLIDDVVGYVGPEAVRDGSGVSVLSESIARLKAIASELYLDLDFDAIVNSLSWHDQATFAYIESDLAQGIWPDYRNHLDELERARPPRPNPTS